MEPTYRIIGADGQEYGPVDLAEIKSWINQNRVDAQTMVSRSDSGRWRPAAEFSELANAEATPPIQKSPAPVSAPATPVRSSQIAAELNQRISRGSRWLYTLAGIQLVALFLFVPFLPRCILPIFVLNRIADFPYRAVWMASEIGCGILLAGLGIFVAQRQTWAFIVALVYLALEVLLALVYMRLVSLLVFGATMVVLYRGLLACFERPR